MRTSDERQLKENSAVVTILSLSIHVHYVTLLLDTRYRMYWHLYKTL